LKLKFILEIIIICGLAYIFINYEDIGFIEELIYLFFGVVLILYKKSNKESFRYELFEFLIFCLLVFLVFDGQLSLKSFISILIILYLGIRLLRRYNSKWYIPINKEGKYKQVYYQISRTERTLNYVFFINLNKQLTHVFIRIYKT